MANLNYFLEKNNKTNEVVYMEYEKLKGYKLSPKASIYDGIRVNKIIFINPSLSEKVIKKKIDVKIKKWVQFLSDIDADPNGGDEGNIRYCIMQTEKLRVNLLNTYAKYLGHDYQSMTLNKIQVILNELRGKLFAKQLMQKKDLYYLDDDTRTSGRHGR